MERPATSKAYGYGAGDGEFRKPKPRVRKELANESRLVGGLGKVAREGAEPGATAERALVRGRGDFFEQHGFRAAAEVDGFDAGDGEVRALGGKQGAQGVEVVVVFGDDLAEAAVGDAVGRLEAFEAAEGFAGDGGGARGGGGGLAWGVRRVFIERPERGGCRPAGPGRVRRDRFRIPGADFLGWDRHMKVLLRVPLVLLFAIGSVLAQAPTLNLSADLVRLGIAAANLVPNQPGLDAGPLLESGVRYAVQNRFARVIADTGAYYFLSGSATNAASHALFAGPTSTGVALTIDLQGADLYFARADKRGFFITSGTNLTVQNFTMDFQQLLFTQATVTSVNPTTRQVQFTVQPGWQNPTALNPLLEPNTGYAYVFRQGQPWSGFVRFVVQQPFTDGAMTILPGSTITGIRPGDIVVLHARVGGEGILAQGLTNSTLRNIKVYAGHAGVRFINSSSSLLERIEVMPRPGTDRLISTVADGIQPQGLGLNNTIRLCRVIRTGDDGISPTIYVLGAVQTVLGARSVQVQGDIAVAPPNEANVVFQRAADGVVLASAAIVSRAAAPAIGGLPQVVLNLDSDVPATVVGSYVYSSDPVRRAGNLLVERNTVQQQTSFRGISVWGVMNATLAGNYIRRASAAGIHIVHQLRVGDWIVPPVVNLTVANNVIDGANTAGGENSQLTLGGIVTIATNNTLTPMAASPHQNVSLTANFIANPGRSALWLSHLSGALVDTNYLFQPNDVPARAVAVGQFATAAETAQPLVVKTSQNVSLGSNVIDTASGRAWVTDTGFRELAAYAPGSTIRLSAYNLGSLATPSASLTDADGKVSVLTVAATTTHALDVVLPASVGLGGAVVRVNAASGSYLGTLFIDSQGNVPALNQATWLISASATKVSADGGAVPLLVVTQPGGAFQVSSADAFVTAGASGAATGVVSVTLARNTGAARTATIEIASQPITLTQAGAADPVIAVAPQSQTAASGTAATFSVSATGAQTYQWSLNGVALAGATASTLTVNSATAANVGTYSVIARNATGSATSSGALLSLANLPGVGRLSNLSILTTISADDPLFTVGTFVSGSVGSKPLLIRAAGPALTVLGVGGALADPKLEVFSGQTVIAANDNWGGTPALDGAFAAVGAFGYATGDSRDAAVFKPNLAPGAYTVQVSGVGGATGTVIAELYDSTPPSQFTALTPRLVNVSVLKRIAAGETLTAGFVISGSAAKQVLIRAVGPALGLPPFNLGGVMADPKLEIYSGQSVVSSNDNWGTPVGAGAATSAQLSAAFAAVGAFALPAGSSDAALLVALAPGNYTTQVSGVGSTGGQMIIEVYEVP